jgi:hypothetical protein
MRLRLCAGALMGTVFLGVAPAPAGSQQASPTLVADQYQVSEGTFVRVSGTGWNTTESGLVSVQVCGNGALNGSADCDLASTAAGGIRDGGLFYTGITIHKPPKPCPCVLRAYTVEGSQQVTTPIEIKGMAMAIPTPSPSTPTVQISDVTIEERDPWTTLFGAAPDRVLVFSVRNNGDVLLHNPPVTLAWGRGSSPDGLMESPVLGDLAPGQTAVSRVPVPMGALSWGGYTVTIRVGVLGGDEATAKAETSVYPWGLLVVALLLLQLVLIWMRNRYRARRVPPVDLAPDDDESEAHTQEAELSPTILTASRALRDWLPGHRRARVLVVAPVIVALLAGCSGDDSDEGDAESLKSDSDCTLTVEEATDVLEGDARVTDVPPLGTELAQPVSRCQYEGDGGWTLQFTAFPGEETFDRLTSLQDQSSLAPEVGDNAYCGTSQGATLSVVSCLFTTDGDSLVLTLSVPNKDASDALEQQIRELATALVNDY